ncbi:MAG: 4-hydroxy-tetrahydrodipicolinate synthase [Myxococcales bacterium]|nr:4-hydroxy-tetrahydrodipicolinate synthase [Myxococcales bacterium]
MISLEAEFLKGSYPPIITPFKDGKVDFDAYANLVEHQIREGSHGVLVNGTTAEPSTLTIEERNQLVSVAVDATAQRVPVVAATGSQSLAETRELSAYAERAGANALLIVTPYYVRPPQRGLVEYYLDLAQRSSLPFMIYHIPGRAAVSVGLETLREIASRADHFVGMKHAVTDLNLVTDALLALGDEFRIFVGLEDLSFPMLAVGACGMMNAVGNLAPRKVAALYEAVAAGKLAEARSLHRDLWELNQAVFYDTNPIAMKYMLRRMGVIPANEHRLPMVPATPELETRLDGVLERAGLI